jgi:quercetin 2,3-dioxygenase
MPGGAVADGNSQIEDDNVKPLIVLPGSVPRYGGQQGRDADLTELLATSAQTGGKLGIFRQTVAPGSGPPAHMHQMEIEFAYVVSGEFKFRVGDRVMSVPVGTFIFVPPKTVHTFKNIGSNPGVLLFGVTPGGFERMFAERQGVDAETNKKLMERFHMQVVGPPLP